MNVWPLQNEVPIFFTWPSNFRPDATVAVLQLLRFERGKVLANSVEEKLGTVLRSVVVNCLYPLHIRPKTGPTCISVMSEATAYITLDYASDKQQLV